MKARYFRKKFGTWPCTDYIMVKDGKTTLFEYGGNGDDYTKVWPLEKCLAAVKSGEWKEVSSPIKRKTYKVKVTETQFCILKVRAKTAADAVRLAVEQVDRKPREWNNEGATKAEVIS